MAEVLQIFVGWPKHYSFLTISGCGGRNTIEPSHHDLEIWNNIGIMSKSTRMQTILPQRRIRTREDMEKKDIIIVGAGPAGLPAAIFTRLDVSSTLTRIMLAA
jgi:hypothetical protein